MRANAAGALITHPTHERTDDVTTTLTDQQPGPAPICVACVGEQLDPATLTTCLRCCGTGLDPDPADPVLRALSDAFEAATASAERVAHLAAQAAPQDGAR